MSLKQTSDGQRFHQRLANTFSREGRNSIYDEMYNYFRNRIYQVMGGEAKGIDKHFERTWENIVLRGELTREKVEEWLLLLLKYRGRMYEIGYYREDEGPAKELGDLVDRIPKGTLLRQWYGQSRAPVNFDEFYNLVQGWCKTSRFPRTTGCGFSTTSGRRSRLARCARSTP